MSELHKKTFISGISKYVKSHHASLAIFLAAYGAFYLLSVILSHWTIADWGKDITNYPPTSINTLLPRSFIDPIFFVTSFPALIIGAAMLSFYSIHKITPKASDNKQYVAILLTASGFIYQVIGAWPLEQIKDYPWQFQKQIALNGGVFTWTLYLLSLIVLLIGVVSLYRHSQIFHKKHSGEEEVNGETMV
ncbi:MAG TPA: hypothetical protein VF350_07565 [Candidatus Bathyarchaeia archaeon]